MANVKLERRGEGYLLNSGQEHRMFSLWTCAKKAEYSLIPFLFHQIFRGNFERNFIVTHRFRRPFKARYVRIHPKTWRGHISMRVELYGCRLGKLTLSCPSILV